MQLLDVEQLRELEAVQGVLLAQVSEITRRIASGTVTPVGKRELTQALSHAVERLEFIL